MTQSKVAITVDHRRWTIFQETVVPVGNSVRGGRSPGTPAGWHIDAATSGFQIDGATDSENVYLVDGVNITQIQNGGVGKNFQMDFLEEVQIKSSSFEAEYGGALGGVINAVPKHGSNTWHGALGLTCGPTR